MTQRLEIPDLPPMLNSKGGLKRMHHQQYRKVRDGWAWKIRALNPKKHPGKVTVQFTRMSVVPADLDNVASGFKVIGDGLVKCGVITGDSPDILTELRVIWVKAHKRADQKTIIKITDVT